MKALVYLGPGQKALQDRPKPGIAAQPEVFSVGAATGVGGFL